MLDNEEPPMVESPDHQSIPEENAREYYIDEPVHLPRAAELYRNASNLRKRFKGAKKG